MKRSLWMLALVVPLSASAQGKEAKPAAPAAPAATAAKSEAGVNWEGQLLRATGAGAPDMKASNPAQARLGAERAAKMDAFRNLLEQAKGVQISAGRTVGDAMGSEEIRGRVEGVVRGFKVVNKRYYSDSGVEMDVEVPLAALTSALAPASDSGIAVNTQGTKKYTGLVVDARGLGAKPVLAPRLLDGAGKPVYGAEALSSDARKTAAVAAWFKSVEDAQKSALVGEKPLVVKAAQLQGSDLVLAEDALKKLMEANASFLAEGRVAIVTQ